MDSQRIAQEPELAPLVAPDDEPKKAVAPAPTGDVVPQMYGGDRQATVKATADAALRTAGTSVPFIDEIQPLMPNVDLSTVTAHVGDEAGAMAHGVGANAFTVGDHIVLPENPTKQTVAHELAHVVQQRNNVAVPGGVGTAGDSHEKHADEIATRVTAGKQVDIAAPPTATSTAVQMEDRPSAPDEKLVKGYDAEFRRGWEEVKEDTAKPKAGDPFGGGHGKKQSVGGKQVGDGGFGARLIGGSAAAAQKHAAQWGVAAEPVQPNTETLDKAFEQQAKFIEGNQPNTHFFTADPVWVQKEKAYSNEWATENMESVQRYKFDQLRWVNSYNDWAPVANQAHMAQAELVESASLMGYDTTKDKDSAAFILGLESSLDMANQLADAKLLGDRKQQSWGTRNDDPTATSKAQPELKGEQLTPKLDSVGDAYRELQVAHFNVYKGLLNDQKHALEAESGKVTEEINSINEVIEFWAGMGEFAQGSYKKVGSAQKIAKKVDDHYKNGDPHAKKELKHAQKDADKAEKDPSNYQHDINSHAHHGNYEDHYDTWGKGGADKVKEGQEAKDTGDIEVAGAGEQPEPAEAAEGPPEISLGGSSSLA